MEKSRAGRRFNPLTWNGGLVSMAVVCGFLFVFPVLMLVVGAFRNGAPSMPADWGFEAFAVYGDPSTWKTLANSLFLAISVSTLGTIGGALLALLVARTDVLLRRIVTPAIVLIVALPPLFFAISWGQLGNPRIGVVNELARVPWGEGFTLFNVNSWEGMIFVIVLKIMAFAYMLLLGPFMSLDRNLEEASQIAGAGRLRTFLRIDVPLIAPSLTGVFILLFVVGLEMFDIPLLFGRPAGIEVFATQIYGSIRDDIPPDYGGASALSMLLFAVVIALVLVQWKVLGDRKFTTITGKSYRNEPWALGKWGWVASAFIVVYLLLALVAPLAQLIVSSLQTVAGVNGDFSLINYESILTNPTTAGALVSTVTVSVVGGFITMALAMAISYAVARNRTRGWKALELATWLPWAAPGIVLALGVAWAYVSVPGLRLLFGTIWLVMIGLIIGAMPIASRSTDAALGQVHPELEEAARISGARPVRRFVDILIPLISPAFVAGWFTVAIVISGNLAIPVLLSGPDTKTVPLLVFELFTNGSTGQASALFVLVLVTLVGAMLVALAGFAIVRQIVSRARALRSNPTLSSTSAALPKTIPSTLVSSQTKE